MEKTMFLIRHGETEWNKKMKLNSYTDIPLSKEGESQIRYLGRSFKDIKIDYIFSSPLTRALQTAEIICNNKIESIKVIDDLKEVSFGSFEGKNAFTLENSNISKEFTDWLNVKTVSNNSGLESLNSVYMRCLNFMKIVENMRGNILVVSHGYFLRILISSAILGLHMRDFKKIWLSNGTCTIIQNTKDYYELHLLNATHFNW